MSNTMRQDTQKTTKGLLVSVAMTAVYEEYLPLCCFTTVKVVKVVMAHWVGAATAIRPKFMSGGWLILLSIWGD